MGDQQADKTQCQVLRKHNWNRILKANTFHSPRLGARTNPPQSNFSVEEDSKIIVQQHSLQQQNTLNIKNQSSEEKLRQIQEVASEYNVQNYNLEDRGANKNIQSSQNARSDNKKSQELKKDTFYPQNQLKKPTKLPSSRDVMKQMQTNTSTTVPLVKKVEEKQTYSLAVSHQVSLTTQIKMDNRATAEDEDFIDDILDDSMELRESQTQTHSSITKTKPNSGISTGKANQSTPSNNKINTTSPSKLNSKFTSSAGVHSRSQFSASNSQQSKNQIKQSVVQGKKTLQSLMSDKDHQADNKSIVQLDLNLSMSNLQRIPTEQLNNINLRSIDLRNNRITSEGICCELFQLPNVWKLQLDNNLITELPDQFELMVGLRQITLGQNQLEKLPESLFKLKNIEKLDLSQNKLVNLSNSIEKLANLKYLYLSENNFTILPRAIGLLNNLQQISLEWFMYIEPLFDKLIKRIIPIQAPHKEIKTQEESSILLVIEAFNQCKKEQVNFFDFIQSFYKQASIKDVFKTLKINKGSTLIHFICKYQHMHLFDLMKEYKQNIDINVTDQLGNSPLIIAIQEKSSVVTDKILREFKDQLNLVYKGINEDDNEQMTPTKGQSKQPTTIVLHPLLLSLRNQLYETALRIFNIMVKNHNKSNQSEILNLNMKDENSLSIMHYLFMNFSTNMELSVELCQEILKQFERGQKNIPQSVKLGLNDQNKQGMTPFDLAVEVKQNQAIEFAIYYNKNLLPAFQQTKLNQKKDQFDLNFNKNARGLTPLHRAILNLNYKAIYLLLQSGDCNLFLKDRDFKTARDYCLLKQFLNKYLRKGESNIIRNIVQKIYHDRIREYEKIQQSNKTEKRGYQLRSGILVKNVQHNNTNFFYMSQRRGNRVKYNSWYTRINQAGGLNGQGNQTKNDQQQPNNLNGLHLNSQQVTHEQKDGDYDDEESEEEQIRIEDVKDDDENLLKANSYVQDSIVKMNLMIGDDQEYKPNRPVDRKANSLLKPTINQVNLNERRLSDQQQQQQNKKTSASLIQKHNALQASTNKTIQVVNHSQKASITSKLSPRQQNMNSDQQKIRISQPITEVVSFDIQQRINAVEIRDVSSVLSHRRDSEEFNIAEEEEGQEEGNDESPSTLPSNKYKYIMSVNNSKLARKPYYKQIQRNRFEREFCIIMDPRVDLSEKMNKLFSVFSQVQQNISHPQKDISSGFYRDGREFLGFLKLELESKEFNLAALKNEILYFQEIIFGNSNFALIINDGNQSARKNTNNNFSLERGPLPMIQETQHENTNISPQKKFLAQPSANKFGFKQMNKTSTNSRQNFSSIQATEQLEEDKSQIALRLNTATSSKNLDQSKQQSSSATTASRKTKVNEVKLVNMKNIVSGSQDDDGAKSPTSPRGNSGQINQKLNLTSTTLQIQSPQSNYGSSLTFQQQNLLKTKESCIKKIEVQITEKQQMSSPQDKNSGKWKQLTINPNSNTNSASNNSSSQNISISGVAKGLQKINSKLSNTPQSQRANQQILSLMTNAQTQNSSSSLNTNRNTLNLQTAQAKTTEVSNIIITSSQNKTSSSLSNRSSSNPRNSLIGNTANNLKQQVQKSQPQSLSIAQSNSQANQGNSSLAKVSYVSFQPKNSNLGQTTQNGNTASQVQSESQPFMMSTTQNTNNNTNTTLTQLGMSHQSKLKAPATKNYNRHTIGKTTIKK
ncbi:leucine rich repeat protein [Stylonychia lemnae]|uniref:Leucine rich repeat protein n=1 Tax=Stylonychia lemnae TaxID=5949 RepID=A0A078AT50_STYLE|nr:leucine rich repeat protein [Stylonychia lemnae]|eukprot:CDW85630.1 leucine rich repeat protein [Stylonychia lemnae]